MDSYSLYSKEKTAIAEKAVDIVKSKIKNNRFVFDESTQDLAFVYLGAEKETDLKISEIIFKTSQPGLRYLNANNCNLKKVVIENCPKPSNTFSFGNGIEEITFKGIFPELQLIDLSKNTLAKIDLSSISSLH